MLSYKRTALTRPHNQRVEKSRKQQLRLISPVRGKFHNV